ncbi:MAG: hypothetical protein WBP22_05770 [Candidatus Saccharimonas sp.]
MSEKINTQPTDFDPSLGAYPMDYAQGLVPLDDDGNPVDPTGTLDARGDGAASFHNADVGGLFDEEELQIPDEATGSAASLEGDYTGEDIQVVNSAELNLGHEATIGLDLDDEAARWLALNDPDYTPPAEDNAQKVEEDV